MKFTYPEDFAMAETLAGAARVTRVGQGFDAHRFGPGDEVWLVGERRSIGEQKHYVSNLPADATIKTRWVCDQATSSERLDGGTSLKWQSSARFRTRGPVNSRCQSWLISPCGFALTVASSARRNLIKNRDAKSQYDVKEK